MLKKVIVSCFLLFMVLCLISCGNGGVLSPTESHSGNSHASSQDNSSVQSTSEQPTSVPDSFGSQVSGDLTGEDALELAIAHAKVEPSAVKRTKIENDMERGVPVYEISFEVDFGEYDYKLTVADGTILDIDYEANKYVVRQSPSNPVTMDGAKEIAVSKVPGVPVRDIRVWEEYDDGSLSFEGEFYFENIKHEFEIDSSTGKILKWDAAFPY